MSLIFNYKYFFIFFKGIIYILVFFEEAKDLFSADKLTIAAINLLFFLV